MRNRHRSRVVGAQGRTRASSPTTIPTTHPTNMAGPRATVARDRPAGRPWRWVKARASPTTSVTRMVAPAAHRDNEAGTSTAKVSSSTSPSAMAAVLSHNARTASATRPATAMVAISRSQAEARMVSMTRPATTSAVARRSVLSEKRCVVRSDAASTVSPVAAGTPAINPVCQKPSAATHPPTHPVSPAVFSVCVPASEVIDPGNPGTVRPCAGLVPLLGPTRRAADATRPVVSPTSTTR